MAKPAPIFPAAVVGDQNLIIAVNRFETQLTQSIGTTETAITVKDASRIVVWMLLSLDLDGEIVLVTAAPTGNSVPVQRGFDGTIPAVHLAESPVFGNVDAYHHNALVSEVEAIETFLGPNGSNLPGISIQTPIPFTPQTPGGALVVGSNAITLSPVPQGVNGSDTNHYLYISAGTGAPEAALITGGSAVAGAASGQIIVTCANAHSGAWTVQSASAGIKEALVKVGGPGGVYIPSGTWNIFGPLVNDAFTSMWGDGETSVIQAQFDGDAIIIGDAAASSKTVSIHKLRAVYGKGLGNFATTGVLWTFRNCTNGNIGNLSALLGWVGFKSVGCQTVTAVNLWSNSNNAAYIWTSDGAAAPNAGTFTNIYGETHAGGVCILIQPTIAGLTINNLFLQTIAANTYGILIQQDGSGPINELVIGSGFVDNCGINALRLDYNAATTQLPGSTVHIHNVRFTNQPASAQPVASINYPLFGLKVANCAFYNAGLGDAVTLLGNRRSTWTGNHMDVAAAAARPLVIGAATGGQVNEDIEFTGNLIGCNGAAVPTLCLATDTSAHKGLHFAANKFLGGIGWAATGAGNRFYESNAGVPVPSIAAASTITILPYPIVAIAGSAAITQINGGAEGQAVTFIFTGATPGGFTASASIARTQAAAQNQAIRLTLNGGIWY